VSNSTPTRRSDFETLQPLARADHLPHAICPTCSTAASTDRRFSALRRAEAQTLAQLASRVGLTALAVEIATPAA
jgi:hypothetical protein